MEFSNLLRLLIAAAAAFALAIVVFALLGAPSSIAQMISGLSEEEPDIPSILKNAKSAMLKEDFLRGRAEQFGAMRGLNGTGKPDPKLREAALDTMRRQELAVRESESLAAGIPMNQPWTPIGPAPIPNGSFPWSGRVISIAVHPLNADIVFVGAAQGGLYRSTDGGANWTSIMDVADSLAIGAIAISPSNPEIVYVGTGEHNFSTDSFFGVGVYRITNATTTANLSGPFNRTAANADIFTGRGISRIIVHPSDPNTIFVATTTGLGGIGGVPSVFPSRGIYRSTNANTATPSFAKLTGLAANTNSSVRDIAIDPSNPDIMIASLILAGGAGGIYRTANALAADPNAVTFTQTQVFNSNSTSELVTEFAAIHAGGDADATFYAATGNLGGRLLISSDGGQTWTQQIDNNFCTPQCFYDVAVAVDPVDKNRVYLGGSPTLIFGFSSNAGTSFTSSGAGVHVDTHAIAVAPSSSKVIYLGTDGGIYKSSNAGSTWASLNNTQFFATQFMSVDVHPSDPRFSIGGTQDNGTNYYDPAGAWARVDGGDGGYAVIDQNAQDLVNVDMYHTYFNRVNSLLGYSFRPTVNSSWSFRGCQGTPANGINCADTATLFYAPLERGPGNPNTIYYGTDRVYRSDDRGINHTVVSQAPIANGVAVSAIGIAPQNDNIRLVGLRDGQMFGTIDGSSTLIDLDPANNVPAGFIARLEIDPTNSAVAYVSLSSFGFSSVYKTTNLNQLGTQNVTWTDASGTGMNSIPQIPVSAFVIDPRNTNRLFAGTDIGVYVSSDGGTTWAPLGTNLPKIAVFGMAITNSRERFLRIATHGRGMYDYSLGRIGSSRFDFDGDGRTDPSVFRPSPSAAMESSGPEGSSSQWWIYKSSDGGNLAFGFGNPSDKVVAADYTGDGKTDVAFWRPTTGEWYILRSEDNSFFAFPFGANGDIPAPGDFDGDGKADPAVFRPSAGTWFIFRSSDSQTASVPFGVAEDLPTVADFDGDGKDDVAVFRPSVSQWWQLRSTEGVKAFGFGAAGDRTAVDDYTGDGKADVAFYRPSTSEFFVIRSEDDSFYAFPWGAAGDIPVPGDYDGDGKTDAAIWRPSVNTWFILGSTAGFQAIPFGAAGDVPVPSTVSVFGSSSSSTDFPGSGFGAIPDGGNGPRVYGPPLNITFNVSGVAGTVGQVEVSFSANHTYVGDLKVRLIAPDLTEHLLFETTGATTGTASGIGSDLSSSNTYSFKDSSGNNWWTLASSGDPIPTGNARTVVSGGAGVPNPPAVTSLNSVFGGRNANGVWTLRFEDGFTVDTGSVTAATLRIVSN